MARERASRESAARRALRPLSRRERQVLIAHEIQSFLALFESLGATREHLLEDLTHGVALLQNDPKLPPLKRTEVAWERFARPLATVLTAWHTSTRWLDEAGKPRVLKLSGSDQFEGLCREILPNAKPRSIARDGLAVGFWRRTGRGALKPIERGALMRTYSPLVIERAVLLRRAWLATMRYNMTPGLADADRRADRDVHPTAIAASLEPEFHRFVLEAYKEMSYRIDNWLVLRQPSARSGPVRYVGAAMFAYTEDLDTASAAADSGPGAQGLP